MHYFNRSRSAQSAVCVLACLLLFHAPNNTTRREAAHASPDGGSGARQPQPQSSRTDVPSDLRAAIEEARYRLEPDATAEGEAGYRAPNPAQGWRARFGAEGLSIETRAVEGREARERFVMRLSAYGYGERVATVERAEIVATKNRLEYRRGSVVEWYLNERRGVEQGFTLREPPAFGGEGARGEALTLRLAIEGNLRAELSADARSVKFLDAAGAPTLTYGQLKAFDAGGRELPARMRVEGNEVRLEVDDAGAQYPLTIDPFIQQQVLRASDRQQTGDNSFGSSVSISGDTAIIGAFRDDSGAESAGSAYVFTRSNGVWAEQQKLQASNPATGDFFGVSVSVSGDTAIIGADAHTNNSQRTGAAYIFNGPPSVIPVLISEFRFAGPGPGGTGAGTDEFIELYNNTDADLIIKATDGSAGWTLRSSDGTLGVAIPNGDVIPARGHYLLANSNGYSLAPYPTSQRNCAGGNCAYGNRNFTSDTPENTGIALFRTTNPANFTLAYRLDAAGPTTEANALYREGVGYAPVSGNTSTVQHSLMRSLLSDTPGDCNDKEFRLVATNGAATLPGATLGAPAPENTDSPVQRNAAFKASMLDVMQPSFAAPNRVRNGAADINEPANSTRGTLKIRRKFTNTTGAEVTRLRFRIVDITTTPGRNSATADLRVLPGSGGVNVMLSNGQSVTLISLNREEPPVQTSDGGGFNTTLSATLAQAIPHKASIYVEFNLGVIEDGNFSFRVNVEASTNTPTNTRPNSKADALRKASNAMKSGTLPPATP